MRYRSGRFSEGVEVAVGIGDPHIELKTAADGIVPYDREPAPEE